MQYVSSVLRPAILSGIRHIVDSHRVLWGHYFRAAWNGTPVAARVSWFLFLINAVTVITLIEFLLLKNR